MSKPLSLSPLAIALVVSLIINALLAGVIAGGALRKIPPRQGPPGGGGEDFAIARSISDVLPEGDRGAIRDAFREAFETSRGLWDDKRAARSALTGALAADPFDKAAVDAAFERMRKADDALTAKFQETLSSELAGLTQAQRSQLVARLKQMEARREQWSEGHRDDHRPPGDHPPSPGGAPPR